MRIRLPAMAVVMLAFSVAVASVQAQGRSSGSTSSSSLFGSSNSTLGSSGSSARNFGRSPGAGATTGGTGSTGQSSMLSNSMRGNRQAGEFVGADTRDVIDVRSVSGTTSGATRRTGATSSRAGARQSRNPNQQAGGRGSRRSARGEVRAGLSVGFSVGRPAAPWVNSALTDRLERCRRIQTRSPMEVLVQDRTTILRGVVATKHDRALAERLVLLEPGIWNVKNELVVKESPGGTKKPAAAVK